VQTYAKAKLSTKTDPGSNTDFRINSDSDADICWITPKILWIHYFVSVKI